MCLMPPVHVRNTYTNGLVGQFSPPSYQYIACGYTLKTEMNKLPYCWLLTPTCMASTSGWKGRDREVGRFFEIHFIRKAGDLRSLGRSLLSLRWISGLFPFIWMHHLTDELKASWFGLKLAVGGRKEWKHRLTWLEIRTLSAGHSKSPIGSPCILSVHYTIPLSHCAVERTSPSFWSWSNGSWLSQYRTSYTGVCSASQRAHQSVGVQGCLVTSWKVNLKILWLIRISSRISKEGKLDSVEQLRQ